MLVCSGLCFAAGGIASVEAAHPARVIYEFQDKLEEEAFLTPYDVCLFALIDMDRGKHYKEINTMLEWYFARMNKLDKQGMTGTFYDFKLQGDKEKVLEQYDSVDGYSGVFLYLLNEYYKATGDSRVILQNWSKVNDIAYTIAYLQQDSGLTIATKNYAVEYLMDNCEAYGGIKAYLALAAALKQKIDTKYYQNVAKGIAQGLNDYLRAPNGVYGWEKEGKRVRPSRWIIGYPDAYSQTFPVYYGIGSEKERAVAWQTFLKYYPAESWQKFPIEQRVFLKLTQKKMTSEGK